jgi:hypothetical protein
MRSSFTFFSPLVTLLFLFSQHQESFGQQGSSATRVSWQLGLELSLSRPEGDAPSYVRQNASDFSTNFGTSATYERLWNRGAGIYAVTTFQVFDFLGIDGGLRLGTFAAKEKYDVSYDPANGNGLTYSSATLRNTYLNLSPSLALRGSWHRISLCAGVEANAFLTGYTKWDFSYKSIVGDGSSEDGTRLDTQDQPIYKDPLHGGGIADYTDVTNRNHGANAIWLAGIAKAEFKLFKRKGSPIAGLGWRLPLMEVLRSQNPSWSLIRGVDAGFEKMNFGTKISTMSMHVGWAF